MNALVTGASKGIGKEIAIELAKRNYNLIIVARDKDKLMDLKDKLNVNVEVVDLDLSNVENCIELYKMVKDKNIDILINNAGYGKFGEFSEKELEEDLNMIDLNIKSVHILTKLFLKDFIKKDRGYILNVSSSAGFMHGGPLMSTYYATKSYVLRLSEAISEELKRKNSNVKISTLCPGPVDTNFNERAGVVFKLKSMTPKKVARIGVDGLFKGKLLIIPGINMKLIKFFERFLSEKIILKSTYNIQDRKRN